VTIRVDADVLAWLKRQGSGYQTRINKLLREAMEGKRRAEDFVRWLFRDGRLSSAELKGPSKRWRRWRRASSRR
jgi:BrnA antitoxin of type II toxin-antitoxin system